MSLRVRPTAKWLLWQSNTSWTSLTFQISTIYCSYEKTISDLIFTSEFLTIIIYRKKCSCWTSGQLKTIRYSNIWNAPERWKRSKYAGKARMQIKSQSHKLLHTEYVKLLADHWKRDKEGDDFRQICNFLRRLGNKDFIQIRFILELKGLCIVFTMIPGSLLITLLADLHKNYRRFW